MGWPRKLEARMLDRGLRNPVAMGTAGRGPPDPPPSMQLRIDDGAAISAAPLTVSERDGSASARLRPP